MKNNKISTERLAKICNVSQGTVDRALHNRKGISENTKKHILAVAREYGYRPNKISNENKGLIGIIVFDLYNEYFSELVMLLEKALRSKGYYSLVMFSDKNKETELECIEAMYNAGVDGIILCPINKGIEFSKYLYSWKIPVVTVGNKVEGIKYIGIDNFSAMQDLTEYVLNKNYKNLIYYCPVMENDDLNMYAQEQRYNGFKSAISQNNNINFSVVNNIDDCKLYLRSDTAIIASTDVYALEVMFSGIDTNTLVVGFDNIPSIYNYKIPLLSVSHDKTLCANAVLNYLINPQNNDDEYISYSIQNP